MIMTVLIFYMKQMNAHQLWAQLETTHHPDDRSLQAHEYYEAILKELSKLEVSVAEKIWRSYAPSCAAFPLLPKSL